MSRRYVELGYTLPAHIVDEIAGDAGTFHESDMAVFPDDGGVTVVVPHLDGTYAELAEQSQVHARIFLDTLIDDDTVSVPVPWRLTLVDSDLMAANLLQGAGEEPATQAA